MEIELVWEMWIGFGRVGIGLGEVMWIWESRNVFGKGSVGSGEMAAVLESIAINVAGPHFNVREY